MATNTEMATADTSEPATTKMDEDHHSSDEPRFMHGFHRGKYSLFCVNGDHYQAGKKILYNPRHFRDFPHYLDHLTDKLKPPFGAVRKICTPNYGHMVRSLDDLRSDEIYVVAGVERFKPYGYAQIDPHPKRRTAPPSYDVEPGQNRRYQVSGRYRKIDAHGKIIKCWPNGNETSAPRTVLLSYRMPFTLESIIEQVSYILKDECNGPIEKLYLPNGIKVMSLDQILPNAHYVALRKNDTFKRANYKEFTLPNLRTSPRLEKKFQLAPLSRSTKTSSQSSPEHSYASNNGSENSYNKGSLDRPQRKEKARREEDQVFHARPVKHKRSSEKPREVDYDQDNGGVFKAKSQNQATKGARPVDDSRHTRTEVPVDRRPAEEVPDEEEEVPHNVDRRGGGDQREEQRVRGREPKNEKKIKKDELGSQPSAAAQPQQKYRSNSKQPTPPSGDQLTAEQRKAKEDADRAAKARREAEDRERAEKNRQQQAQIQQRRDEKKKQEEDKKRKEEEDKIRKQEEEEKKRKMEADKKKNAKQPVTSTPARSKENLKEEPEKKKTQATKEKNTKNAEKDQDNHTPVASPINDDRSGSAELQEEQDRKKREENSAATKIQAHYRGYQTRKDLEEKEAKRRDQQRMSDEQENSLLRDDDPLPQENDDDWGPEPIQSNDNKYGEREEKAAITIQAGFRGYKARQEVKLIREERNQREVNPHKDPAPPSSTSTPPPPSPLRKTPPSNPSTNKTVSHNEMTSQKENAAATKIQASYRGYQTRKELNQKKAASSDAEARQDREQTDDDLPVNN